MPGESVAAGSEATDVTYAVEAVDAVAVEEAVADAPILDAELEEPEDDQLKVLAAAEAKAKARPARGGGRGARQPRAAVGPMMSSRKPRESTRGPRAVAVAKPRSRKTSKG